MSVFAEWKYKLIKIDERIKILAVKQSHPTSRILQQKDPIDALHNNYEVTLMDKLVH